MTVNVADADQPMKMRNNSGPNFRESATPLAGIRWVGDEVFGDLGSDGVGDRQIAISRLIDCGHGVIDR